MDGSLKKTKMKVLNSGLILLVILACTTTPPSVHSAITEPPRDTAALIDSRDVRLNCSLSPGSSFTWETFVLWMLFPQLIYSSATGPTSNPNYTVSQDGTSISINNLTPGLANVYVCKESDRVFREARVAAMNKLSCNQPNSILTVSDGESFPFNCSTSYHSNIKSPNKPLAPTLAILAGNGSSPLFEERAKEPGLIYLERNVTATAEMDDTEMKCKLYFEDDGDVSTKALYEDSCSFTLQVLHGVTKAKIDANLNSSLSIVGVGHTIVCNADGRPRPDVEWRDSNNSVILTGEKLTMTMSMVSVNPTTFKCVATNKGPLGMRSAEDTIQLIVSIPHTDEISQGIEMWAVGVIVGAVLFFIIILVVVVIIICCLRRGNRDKPYKPPPKKNGKSDPTTKNLIYNPAGQSPNTGPGVPGIFMAGSNQNAARSPPPRPEYSNSPFGRPDHTQDDYAGGRNMNASVGHGDLGVSGLSNSRGGDMNTIGSSRGNLQESGKGQQGFTPRQGYGGSSEALNFPPLPPRHVLDNRYHDNHQTSSGPKRGGRQNEHKSTKSPPPPTSYLDPGFGRQPSITSTSTNRSNSSDGSRMAGRVDKSPAGRVATRGGKRTSPKGQGRSDGTRKQGKKNSRQSSDTGYPSDVHSLQGSEV